MRLHRLTNGKEVTSISVRLAGREHLSAIPGIEIAAAALFSEADLPESLRYKVTHISHLNEALEQGRLWVALCEDKPVGFAAASVIDGAGYLDELDVMPEFCRQGIGTKLVSMVIDWARAQQFSCLTLVTFRHLAWNAPFYEQLEFRTMEATEHGPELADLIREEHRVGLDGAKRVAMQLVI